MEEINPNIILDFVLKGESIYIRFVNPSDFEAYRVRVNFDQTIWGLNGSKKISGISIFRNLTYFPPHKEFLIYVDEIRSFFNALKRVIVKVQLNYSNAGKKRFRKEIIHNLKIYKDFPIIISK